MLVVVVGGYFLLSDSQTQPVDNVMEGDDATMMEESMGEDEASVESVEIEIVNYTYTPATITVKAGTTVTWTNGDSDAHTATADDGNFDTGLLAMGESGSVTFDTPGTYNYHCTPHPNMRGTIIVEE